MTALYFFLVEVCNRLGWKEEFGITAKECMDALGINAYNTHKKNFDLLVENGFIEIRKKSVNQYQCNIIALSNFDKALDKASIKHVKHSKTIKTIKLINNIDFVSDEFKELFQNWIDYKSEIKKPYKSERSLKTAYKKLLELSGSNLSNAKQIVENSIANGWQGLFAIKEPPTPKQKSIMYQQADFDLSRLK